VMLRLRNLYATSRDQPHRRHGELVAHDVGGRDHTHQFDEGDTL
jgi:hypothetical protein